MGNNCQLRDLEVCYKGAQQIFGVTENGDATFEKEVYGDETELAYYYCTNCGTDWSVTSAQSPDEAWKLAKEHLNVQGGA